MLFPTRPSSLSPFGPGVGVGGETQVFVQKIEHSEGLEWRGYHGKENERETLVCCMRGLTFSGVRLAHHWTVVPWAARLVLS